MNEPHPADEERVTISKKSLIRLILELERQSFFNDWALLRCEAAITELSQRLHGGGMRINGFVQAKSRLWDLLLTQAEKDELLSDERFEAWKKELQASSTTL